MKVIDDIISIRKVQDNGNDKFVLTIGDSLVVPHKFENEEDAEKYVEEKPIELIFGIALVVAKKLDERKENGTMVNNNNNNAQDYGNN